LPADPLRDTTVDAGEARLAEAQLADTQHVQSIILGHPRVSVQFRVALLIIGPFWIAIGATLYALLFGRPNDAYYDVLGLLVTSFGPIIGVIVAFYFSAAFLERT
jgi:hypothetical protein